MFGDSAGGRLSALKPYLGQASQQASEQAAAASGESPGDSPAESSSLSLSCFLFMAVGPGFLGSFPVSLKLSSMFLNLSSSVTRWIAGSGSCHHAQFK